MSDSFPVSLDLDHEDLVFDAVAERVGVLDTAVNGSDVNVVSHNRSVPRG